MITLTCIGCIEYRRLYSSLSCAAASKGQAKPAYSHMIWMCPVVVKKMSLCSIWTDRSMDRWTLRLWWSWDELNSTQCLSLCIILRMRGLSRSPPFYMRTWRDVSVIQQWRDQYGWLNASTIISCDFMGGPGYRGVTGMWLDVDDVQDETLAW